MRSWSGSCAGGCGRAGWTPRCCPGALDPRYEQNRRAYLACAWLPPKWDWVDPLKDAKAEIEQIAAGLKSRTQALAERGYDAEQVDAEIAADQARERTLGLRFGAKASSGPLTPDTIEDAASQDADAWPPELHAHESLNSLASRPADRPALGWIAPARLDGPVANLAAIWTGRGIPPGLQGIRSSPLGSRDRRAIQVLGAPHYGGITLSAPPMLGGRGMRSALARRSVGGIVRRMRARLSIGYGRVLREIARSARATRSSSSIVATLIVAGWTRGRPTILETLAGRSDAADVVAIAPQPSIGSAARPTGDSPIVRRARERAAAGSR